MNVGRALTFSALLFLTGCASLDNLFLSESETKQGVRIDEIRSITPHFRVVQSVVSRERFKKSFASARTSVAESAGSVDQIRLIRVFDQDATLASKYPRYRLFEIAPESPYDIIGLRNTDILVAVNGYVLFQPLRFKQFVNLLQNESGADFEIIRGGNPVKISFQLVDASS